MNTLEIVACTYQPDSRLLTTYRFNDQEIDRGVELPERLTAVFNGEDSVMAKLQQYIGLADAVYCYDFDYFDEIVVPFELDSEEINYFETMYFRGLAEFRYVNGIELTRKIRIRCNSKAAGSRESNVSVSVSNDKALLLNGGGKDGLVAFEIAKKLGFDLAWFSLNKREVRRKMVEVSGLEDYLEADRVVAGNDGIHKKYKGHKPMSMFVMMLSALIAYMDGRKYIIAASEYSANFPNLIVDGQAINHQYSKSVEAEVAAARLFEHGGIPVRYFSIVRPLYELQTVKIFAKYQKYHHVFLSCNEGMTSDEKWCLECAKCAFVVGALYVFNRESAESVWGAKSAVYDSSRPLVDESIELINPEVKPFECVGTTEENAVLLAALLADVGLTSEQQQRYEHYMAAIADRPSITIESLNDSDHFPAELRTQILSVLEAELRA